MAAGVGESGCAAQARALDEPMAGTAPTAARWLCLEDPGPWPRDLAQHADPAVAEFVRRASAAGFRPLLIRRHGGTSAGPARLVVLADTDPATAAASTLMAADSAELARLPLPVPGAPLPGAPSAAPLLLVCTADRDQCCATDGLALARELHAGGEPGVWECSHLGGHRFAPTALVLPTGYVYGRLDRPAAAAVLAAAAAGEVVPDGCRGRSTWSEEGQVAELAVRAHTGLRASDALGVHEPTGARVPFVTVPVTDRTGRRWAVDVERVEVDTARPASCGARSTLMVPLRAAAPRPLPTADAHR